MKNVLRVLIILSLSFIASCGDDEQRTATITGMNPNQVSIGQQNAAATINGTNLTATAVSLGADITVTGFNVRSSSEIDVQFNVSDNASPGPRTVTLTTTRGQVNSGSILNVMANRVPTARFTISPSAGSLATVFEFDANGSVDAAGATGQNADLSYNWKFGDGAVATGRKVKHKYQALGVHNVELKATDAQGGFGTATKSVEVLKNSPPHVQFKVKPGLKGDTNTTFKFDASGSSDPDGKIADYIWDFGDGSKRRGEVVEHRYDKKGNYVVILKLVDNKGNAASDQRAVEVEKATEEVCKSPGGSHPQIIRGEVIAVEPGTWAIVDFGSGRDCRNTFHKCDDFRLWGASGPKEFFGIVDKMVDRGNGIFAVHNVCPLHWPPAVGDEVFVYYKTCHENHCPGRPGFP